MLWVWAILKHSCTRFNSLEYLERVELGLWWWWCLNQCCRCLRISCWLDGMDPRTPERPKAGWAAFPCWKMRPFLEWKKYHQLAFKFFCCCPAYGCSRHRDGIVCAERRFVSPLGHCECRDKIPFRRRQIPFWPMFGVFPDISGRLLLGTSSLLIHCQRSPWCLACGRTVCSVEGDIIVFSANAFFGLLIWVTP